MKLIIYLLITPHNLVIILRYVYTKRGINIICIIRHYGHSLSLFSHAFPCSQFYTTAQYVRRCVKINRKGAMGCAHIIYGALVNNYAAHDQFDLIRLEFIEFSLHSLPLFPNLQSGPSGTLFDIIQ